VIPSYHPFCVFFHTHHLLGQFLTPFCVCPIKACCMASLRTRSHAIWLKFPSADWPSIFSLNERKTNKSRGCSQGVVCAGITTSFKYLARAVSSTALCKWAWHASRSNTQSRFGNTCAKFLHKVSKYSPWSQLWPKKSFATKANPAPGRTLLQHRDGGAAHVHCQQRLVGGILPKQDPSKLSPWASSTFCGHLEALVAQCQAVLLPESPISLWDTISNCIHPCWGARGFHVQQGEHCTICRMRMPHNKKRDKWTQKQSSKFNPESGYCPCPCCLWAYCYWK